MHYIYILYSKTLDKFYVGETSDVDFRLKLHLQKAFPKSFSKSADDWILKLAFKCDSRNDAIYLERFIKKMKSKVFIVKVIDNPNILSDILNKK
jgi:putative endonuclease